MEYWIPATLFAAFVQNLRFMLQKRLRDTALSTGGATYVRFLYGAPLAGLALVATAAATGEGMPRFGAEFWLFAAAGGLGQILATMCVVALMAARNFTVGMTLRRTEIMQAALLGMIFLGESVSAAGLLAIAIGFAGVLLLSRQPGGGAGHWTRHILNKASGFGLASGFLFGMAAIGYRGASLSLEADSFLMRSCFTLACVTALQAAAMTIWIRVMEREQIALALKSWRMSALVGATSMLGSLGWFTAFTLQQAAYVMALGQVEIVFSFLGSHFVFRERSPPGEIAGILLVMSSVLLLIYAIW